MGCLLLRPQYYRDRELDSLDYEKIFCLGQHPATGSGIFVSRNILPEGAIRHNIFTLE